METKDIVNKRTGLGAGIGAIVGFFFGGPLGSAAGAVVGGAIANVAPPSRKGLMTAKRKIAYDGAMESKDPQYIKGVADAFEGEGLIPYAEMLRKRAALRALPPEIKEARRDLYRQAMASDRPDEIDATAATFEKEGQTDAANSLGAHANAVRAAHEAGKSAKPMPDGKMIEAFAEKLAKTIVNFGPDSKEAQGAASNFVQARGAKPTKENVAEVIAACAAELKADAQEPTDTSSAAAATPPEEAEAPEEASAAPQEVPAAPPPVTASAASAAPVAG